MSETYVDDLPKGIQKVTELPDASLDALWNSIIVEDELKERLLSQAVLNFNLRPKLDRTDLPLHGVILLVGAPGTGKTSLARGLANETAQVFKGRDFRLVEVDAHSLTSSAMGKTQRAVSNLFEQTLSELASKGPTVVLLDEVETLAVDRSRLSLDANPVDIHRATDAVLVQLDHLAESHQHLLFLATSNYPKAVDDAFVSRCDLVVDVPLPNSEACKMILSVCLEGIGKTYPEIVKLTQGKAFDACAKEFVGHDGRTIRKIVANALAWNKNVALNPGLLSIDHLISAAKSAQINKIGGNQ